MVWNAGGSPARAAAGEHAFLAMPLDGLGDPSGRGEWGTESRGTLGMTSIPRREQVAMSALGGQYRGPVLELDDASPERGLELATRFERHDLPDAPSAPAQHRGARDLELR